MKKYILMASAAMFAIGTVSESMAGVVDSGYCNDDETCLWSLDSEGTLTISAKEGAGKVQMGEYNCEGRTCNKNTLIRRPWEENIANIHNIVIGDNITSIGKDAFQSAVNLKTVSGMNDVIRIANGAFSYAESLANFTILDSVATVEGLVFFEAKNLSKIIIPDSWGDEGGNVSLSKGMFYRSCFATENRPEYCPALSDMKIVCKGETSKCEAALAKFKTGGAACAADSKYCLNEAVQITSATEAQCNSTQYYYTGNSCEHRPDDPEDMVCTGGYAKLKNNCVDPLKTFAKKHWTPAEVNEWLYDENNTITITFKHQ